MLKQLSKLFTSGDTSSSIYPYWLCQSMVEHHKVSTKLLPFGKRLKKNIGLFWCPLISPHKPRISPVYLLYNSCVGPVSQSTPKFRSKASPRWTLFSCRCHGDSRSAGAASRVDSNGPRMNEGTDRGPGITTPGPSMECRSWRRCCHACAWCWPQILPMRVMLR